MALKGTCVPPWCPPSGQGMEPGQLERRAQLLHGRVVVPVLVARLRHVCVMAKGCGPLQMCLGEEPNAAAGHSAVAESSVSRWLLTVIW